MRLFKLLTFIRSPSKTPFVTSVALGALAALGAPAVSWVALINVCLFITATAYGILKSRNYVYQQEPKLAWSESERKADFAGKQAANSYFAYANSFLNKWAWQHPFRFGQAMFANMERQEKSRLVI